jgi:hypothetical protein
MGKKNYISDGVIENSDLVTVAIKPSLLIELGFPYPLQITHPCILTSVLAGL